jgi:hypothetical protein
MAYITRIAAEDGRVRPLTVVPLIVHALDTGDGGGCNLIAAIRRR